MFKILDNRNQFYQWDIDRIIVVEDDTINQVHFCNRTDDCSLVCEVYELDGMRVVNVPNILLQDDWKINVYGYDKNYTKFSDTFEVIRRTKPTDYVYTETETVNYNTLLEKMNNIDETIEGTVEKYLDENPPQVDLTGYATEEYVDNAISAIPEVDLSDYALKTEIPSTTGLATEKYVDDAIAGLEIPDPDLTGYATEKYVDDAIAGIDIPEQDLSNYYTKTQVDNLIPDTSKFLTEIPSQYITENELRAEGFLTAIPAEYITETELTAAGYQTEAQVIALINANLPANAEGVEY